MTGTPGTAPVVIVGGGHAGFHVALFLREEGSDVPIVLVDRLDGPPVQRPPLSKAMLLNDTEPRLEFRKPEFYAARGITLLRDTVTGIDRDRRVVRLGSGGSLGYRELVLATGCRARETTVPGAALAGIRVLRVPDDARAVRDALAEARDVVVVGGGFIGLEAAAAARRRGCAVTVVESLPRVMQRVVSNGISGHFRALHEAQGVRVLTGTTVRAFDGDARVRQVELADGTRIPADLVVLGIGVEPEAGLARECGLAVGDGVEVDGALRTSDPLISAVGDCASFPAGDGRRRRLESVQNAADQARVLAARLAGRTVPFDAVPWFWTEQFSAKLQIAGLLPDRETETVRLAGDDAFSVLHFHRGRLVAVESVNRPVDHVAARRLLAGEARLSPDDARDPQFRLSDAVAARTG
ncbi:NAD(P)/FAD-dependent oxidoreductase [Amycolatopsis nivea]|uniref:NAD(P)/FAD-dependent oxidoreductase n=1 Tax=Amycolatopsis nivea TaxID=1644109 RepID=UPI00107055F8|nr:FAD-dependent oxidoreductase [Amycolatopsis nivea]